MAVVLALLLLLLPAPSGAETGTPPGEGGGEAIPAQESAPTPPDLGLDSLLRPGSEWSATPDVRGDRDERAWREAFAAARAEVAELEQRLAALQQKIRETSHGEMVYSPSGSGIPSDPEVLKLRAQLKRDRQSLAAAQARLRDLEVEASLSGVPDSWREEER